jgi:hypothetical protein
MFLLRRRSIIQGESRLLQLAALLDAADARHRALGERPYKQETYSHRDCGTPACALGHWVWDQRERLPDLYNYMFKPYSGDHDLVSPFYEAGQEFGITQHEVIELFGSDGCNDAQTARQAAAYIRGFVLRKQRSRTLSYKLTRLGRWLFRRGA